VIDLAPVLGIVLSVATLMFTAVGLLQKADSAQVDALRDRVTALEIELKHSEEQRALLLAQVEHLTELLLQSTEQIRSDVHSVAEKLGQDKPTDGPE